MAVLPKRIYRLNDVITGIPMAFFPEQGEKKILKFLSAQKLAVNRRRSNAVGSIISHSKPYYTARLRKTRGTASETVCR